MNAAQLIAILKARFWVLVTVMLAVTGMVVGATLIAPKRYTATASVIVDSSQDNGPGRMTMTSPAEKKAYLSTQVEVLTSRRVADQVVEGLAPADRAKLEALWHASGGKDNFNEWAAGTLSANVRVSPSRESNVIEVAYRSPDPELSAAIANAFVDRYIGLAVELKVEGPAKYQKVYQAQVEEERKRLEAARAKLSAFNVKNGILVTDERIDVENARLADLSKEVVAMEALLADSASRASQAGRAGGRLEEFQRDPVIVQIDAALQDARTELSRLQDTLGERHPRITELRGTINDLVRRRQVEIDRAVAQLRNADQVNRGKVGTLKSALEAQRATVAKMTAARSEAEGLLAEVRNAQQAFDEVSKQLNQTRIEAQATQTNVSRLEQAVPATRPNLFGGPLVIAVAGFVGTLLGILAVIALELFDRRIRTEDQLVQMIDQPLIGTVPSFKSKEVLGISPMRQLSGQPRRLPA